MASPTISDAPVATSLGSPSTSSKIVRAFVSELENYRASHTIVESNSAHDLDTTVTAEGVENRRTTP
jgi:EAL domain-containing protein (putative c-di-GMP-specific phosphodiesterase class I)